MKLIYYSNSMVVLFVFQFFNDKGKFERGSRRDFKYYLLFVNPFYAVQLHIKSNVTALMLNKML